MNTEGECRERGESLVVGLMGTALLGEETGWLLTWLRTTPQQLTDENIQPVGVNIGETWGRRCTCEQRVESVLVVLHCYRTKTAATRAVDCKTTVVKAGERRLLVRCTTRLFLSH